MMKSIAHKHLLCAAAFLLAAMLLAQAPAWAEAKAYGPEDFLASADSGLNYEYEKILHAYGQDHAFIAKLKASQRAWLRFRDAEMAALFPEEQKVLRPGSGLSEAQMHWLAVLTEERTVQLRRWVYGVENEEYPSSIRPRAK